MRTTFNIDEEVLRKLKREAERSRTSLTATVNRVLRLGIERAHPEAPRDSYRCPTFSMGFPPLPELDKALRLAAMLEDDETVQKLSRYP